MANGYGAPAQQSMDRDAGQLSYRSIDQGKKPVAAFVSSLNYLPPSL